jgi:hypothetical protein
MKKQERQYEAPSMERIPVEPGSVMASSDPLSGSTPAPAAPGGGNFTGTSAATRATSRDLDNLINDILTVGH